MLMMIDVWTTYDSIMMIEQYRKASVAINQKKEQT